MTTNYIYLTKYNAKEEFYKKVNCILQGTEYNGIEYKKTFKFNLKNEKSQKCSSLEHPIKKNTTDIK